MMNDDDDDDDEDDEDDNSHLMSLKHKLACH